MLLAGSAPAKLLSQRRPQMPDRICRGLHIGFEGGARQIRWPLAPVSAKWRRLPEAANGTQRPAQAKERHRRAVEAGTGLRVRLGRLPGSGAIEHVEASI